MVISPDTRAFFRNLVSEWPPVTAESYATPGDIAAISQEFGIPAERLAIPTAKTFLALPRTNPSWDTWDPYDACAIYAEGKPIPDVPSDLQQIHHWLQDLNHPDGPKLPLVFIRTTGLHRALRVSDGPYQPFVITEVHAQSQSWTPPYKPSSPLTLTPLVREENRWKLSRNVYPPRNDTEDYLAIPFQYGQDYSFPYTAVMRSTHLRLILDTSVEDFIVQFPVVVDTQSFAAAENAPAYNTLLGADLTPPKDITVEGIYASLPDTFEPSPSGAGYRPREAVLERELIQLGQKVLQKEGRIAELSRDLQTAYARWGLLEEPWWRTFDGLRAREYQAMELVFGQGWGLSGAAREMEVDEVRIILYIRNAIMRFNDSRGIHPWRHP